MAKKKKHEEHENLERWLVSYADFMTLLFATFVVLYALAQIDIKEFGKLEESIKMAFNNSPISGGQHLLEGIGETAITQSGASENDSVIPPIMEYLSVKYEKNSMETIEDEIEEAVKKVCEKAASEQDSIGGILQTAIYGLPVGLGDPWFSSVEGKLANGLFGIGGIKGIEFGEGFNFANLRGSKANDEFEIRDNKIVTKTNHNGGINGGITNGMPVMFNVVVKPFLF